MKTITIPVTKKGDRFLATLELSNLKFNVKGRSLSELEIKLRKRAVFAGDIRFGCDVPTMFALFDGVLTNAAIERITGINQRLLWFYATGRKKPGPAQREKLLNGLLDLGQELRSIQLTETP